ncbi:MAG: argininosuccinate synthase [Deltaproteobacteria bacterium]|nr:argininosuccinate synthase [Deltaproteobacteria bacterium]
MHQTLAVAFSGGLDTSYLVARYAEAGHKVLAITVDTGGWTREGREALRAHALRLGAAEHVLLDGLDALYDHHISWLIRGNVMRGGVYPLAVGVERVAQARLFAAEAAARGATLLVHGSTGAGNDQVRFDVALRALAPAAEVIAPIRDEALSRATTMAWLAERGLGPLQSDATLSINRGLWGTTAGGRETHDPWAAPEEDAWTTTTAPSQAPAEGTTFVLGFEEGLPVSVDGEPLRGWEAVEALADLGAAHGFGRGIHLGDTILGIKGRIAFEAPAAAILIPAHRELEKLVLTGGQRFWKDHLGNLYGDLVHEARFLDPLARDIEAFLASSQRRVTGEVRVTLRQGALMITGVRSPYSMVAVQETAYGEHTSLWTAEDARGFCRIHGTAQVLAARAGGAQ